MIIFLNVVRTSNIRTNVVIPNESEPQSTHNLRTLSIHITIYTYFLYFNHHLFNHTLNCELQLQEDRGMWYALWEAYVQQCTLWTAVD